MKLELTEKERPMFDLIAQKYTIEDINNKIELLKICLEVFEWLDDPITCLDESNFKYKTTDDLIDAIKEEMKK
jgi:hypothetical protein